MEKEGNLADVVKFMGSEIDIPDAILDNEIAKGVYLDILEVVRSMQFEKASYILNAVREDKQFYQEEVKGFFYRKGGNREVSDKIVNAVFDVGLAALEIKVRQ